MKHRNPFLTAWSLHWLLVLVLLWVPLAASAVVQKDASGDFLAWPGVSGAQPLLEAAPCLGFEDSNRKSASGICAAENNYLAHSEAMARAALKDKQAKGALSPAEQQQLTNLEVLDIARDLALKDACQTQGDACNAARRDLNAAIGSYATTAAGYNARLSAAGNKSVTAELNQTLALSNDPVLAQQTLWDSFKEFAGPQAAGYAAGAVLGKFIGEAQAVYAAIKAEAGVVPSAVASGARANASGVSQLTTAERATGGQVIDVNPAELRWTQTTAGGNGRADAMRTSMAENGYNGPPIDVVKTSSGIVTVDHTRAAVALEQGITSIPATLHLPTDLLPASMAGRFGSATTWGEAAAYRAANQRPPLPADGTPMPPKLPTPK